MLSVLNMELEVVRTVFRGKHNEVSVYLDSRKGGYYTVVSINSNEIAKELTGRMTVEGLFSQNRDFVGSFVHKDTLALVFLYRPENQLCNKEGIYADTFLKRKELALSFLTSLAETELQGGVGHLLITERNVNVSPDGKVYLNYFLDFEKYTKLLRPEIFFQAAALFAFDILAREYSVKYEQDFDRYPEELQLMRKKVFSLAFQSFSQIIAFVKSMADQQKVRRRGIGKILDVISAIKDRIVRKPVNIFLALIVVITICYAATQIFTRLSAGIRQRENTVYVGLQTIGEVYLGEEDV